MRRIYNSNEFLMDHQQKEKRPRADEWIETCLAEGKRALAEGRAEDAQNYAQQAYKVRKLDQRIWQLFADTYQQLGDDFSAGCWQGMLLKKNGGDCQLPKDSVRRERMLQGIGYTYANPRFAPFTKSVCIEEGRPKLELDCIVGRQLRAETDGRPGYYVGVYNPLYPCEMRGFLAMLCQRLKLDKNRYQDMTFDFMRAQSCQEADVQAPKGQDFIQPLAGSDALQKVQIRRPDGSGGETVLAMHETSFLRMDSSVHISSKEPFWLGTPILLRHSGKRRRIVLNILADGLSWGEQKNEEFENVPNIMEFFSRGTIFDNAYSGSEFTYPSVATIETGMLPHHSQIFSDEDHVRLEPERLTMAEQMHRLGYYCIHTQGDSEDIYNGVLRGYDRILANHFVQPAFIGVERTIRQLEALDETDQFIFLHCFDPHPLTMQIQCPEIMQMKLPLEERCNQDDAPSVILKATHRNQEVNRQNIRDMDRQLGQLFRYLETHYDEDEYLVCLYSDHGSSVYSEKPWLLSRLHANSALMLRGGGVPHYQRPTELMSTADIYSILGHFCGYPTDAPWLDGNLPEVFGGRRREMVISQSIFAGQTRKICLRTEHYACRFETEAFTRDDGTVDASAYSLHVFLREGEEEQEVFDENVRQEFQSYLRAHAEEFMLEGLE